MLSTTREAVLVWRHHEEVTEGVERRSPKGLCKDIGQLAGAVHVIQHYFLVFGRLTEEGDPGGDVLHPFRRGIVIGEHNGGFVVTEDNSRRVLD